MDQGHRQSGAGEAQLAPPGTPPDPEFSETGRITLRTRFFLVSMAFSVAIIVLVGISYVGLQALSGARAYVHGESQWTKAQKQSVISLLEYAMTGEQRAFDQHLEALEVIYGDRAGRLTLDSPEPDDQVAREGYLAGRNHPKDIDLMIRLFRYGRNVELFDQAVEVWARGDDAIDELVAAGEALRAAMLAYGVDSPEVHARIDRILALDLELTDLEDRFSYLIGELSRKMARWFALLVIFGALALMICAHLVAVRLFRTAERADRALRESEQRYRALVDQPNVGMWHLDDRGCIRYLNPAMRSLLELDDDEPVHGESMDRFVAPRFRKRVEQDREARSRGATTTSEIELITAAGDYRVALVHGAPVMMARGDVLGHVGTCLDITERKLAEEQLRFQAFHDPLTGLPNRQLFMDRLVMALKRSRRNKSRVAVLFVDLDRFKVVNDSMGHAVGDVLLRKAAHRISTAVRERDSLARFGGDEFGLILEEIGTPEDVLEPARRIVEALTSDFSINQVNARIGASVGIALSRGEHEAADLLRFADIAMYVAKRRGGGTWHVFDPRQDAQQVERLQFENQLWAAADEGQLVLHYQPIVRLDNRQIVAIEALVRWQHPTRGLLQPREFIPLAEETGAIVPISQWITRQAINALQALDRDYGKRAPRQMSINISAAEFRFADPVSAISIMVEEAGLQADRLNFEVTESLLMQDPAAIARLERRGFAVAIDDFGTGYASLDRIRQVRFSAIKIDRTFVVDLGDSSLDEAIIESIVLLGRKLGMKIIAEGIETAEQLEVLRRLGCELGQGYLFSRPVPLEELSGFEKDRGALRARRAKSRPRRGN